MPAQRPAVLSVTLVVALALLAGCATPTGSASTAPSDPAPSDPATPPAEHFPLTVHNCGVDVTFNAPPRRVVTIKSSATEMLLALGAGDRIVGTGFLDGPVPQEWAQQAADIPALADRVPAAEVVLETQPDLVYAGWESALTGEGAGDRTMLADLGVHSYVSPAACREPEHQPDRLTVEHLFAEITEVAAILGLPDAGEQVVADQQELLATIPRDDRGLTALWYSSGTDIPYVGAGIGAPALVMDLIGLTNIAGGVHDTWASFSWEQVVADDPDVIVLVDAAWNSAEQKRELLSSNPATANLTAVQNERYLIVPFPASEAGVRTIPAAVDLAEQLAGLSLG